MIRRATIEDADALLDMGYLMFKESVYSSLTWDRDRALAEYVWTLNRGAVFIYERDNKPIGMVLGHVAKPWFSSDLVGYEECFYVLPEHRSGRVAARLIEHWSNWCINHGAKMLRPSTSCGTFTSERLYEALGFRAVGGNFVKDLV